MDLVEIGTMIDAADRSAMAAWSTALVMLGTMPQAEYDLVSALIGAAIPPAQIKHEQVSDVLTSIRPHDGEAVRAQHPRCLGPRAFESRYDRFHQTSLNLQRVDSKTTTIPVPKIRLRQLIMCFRRRIVRGCACPAIHYHIDDGF